MAGDLIASIKRARIEEHIANGNSEEIKRLTDDPLFYPMMQDVFFHGEEESSKDKVNELLKDVLNDLMCIDGEILLTSKKYKNLLDDMRTRMEEMEGKILEAQEKMMDMNMLCGEDSSFIKSVKLDNSFFEEDYFDESGILTLPKEEDRLVNIRTVNYSGNGMAGNFFVYKDLKFLSDHQRTDDVNIIKNADSKDIFEYQRLKAKTKEDVLFAYVNYDNANIQLVLELEFESPVNMLRLFMPKQKITIDTIATSSDGIAYSTSYLNEDIWNTKDNYNIEREGYIYGSGILTFDKATHVKVSMTTDQILPDRIAFVYTPA